MISKNNLFQKIIFNTTNSRSFLLKKNIIYSIVLKGGSILITLLLVPLTINYINPIQYGIWLTISSLVYWFHIMDIGLGNGLKNEIAYSLALNDESKIRTYVSTTYALIFLIAISLFFGFYIISSLFDWNKILNIDNKLNIDIRFILVTFFGFFCLEFVLQLINSVLSATQQIFKTSIIFFIGQLLGLILTYIFTLTVSPDLKFLILVLGGAPILALFVASIYLYSNELKHFAPSIKRIDFRFARKLFNVGGLFFFIQIGAMILIHSNNFIISKILGPEHVTTYNIAFRLFSILSALFAIVIMPYWSAFTDAYAKKDFEWIKSNIRKIRLIWLLLVFLGVAIFIYSDQLYKIWINNSVQVPWMLSLVMLIYTIVFMWHTLHVYFLNGIGKIKLQLLVVIVGNILGIPLVIYFGKLYGLVGIVITNTLIFGMMGFIYTIQIKKIINNTAVKIWNK